MTEKKESKHSAWFIRFLHVVAEDGSQVVLVKFSGKEYRAKCSGENMTENSWFTVSSYRTIPALTT